MHDQAQAWSDRQEPVMEEVPAQRPPAEEHPTGTGPDGAWEPAGDRVVSHEDRAAENADRAAENDERAVGVAPVPGGSAAPDDGTAPDEAARDETAADHGTDDEAARDEGAVRHEAAVDDEVRDDEVRDHAALHDAAHESPDEPPAGGVPDDAVSRDDAPVPAAAYDTTETTHTDTAGTEAADSAAAGTEAAEATGAGQATEAELMPGSVPEEPVSALFDAGTADDFRDRWQRVQMQFVDDPRAAAEQARSLVDDVVSALQASLTNQRGSLDGWQSGQGGDTEELRVAVRRYRDFLNRVLGL